MLKRCREDLGSINWTKKKRKEKGRTRNKEKYYTEILRKLFWHVSGLIEDQWMFSTNLFRVEVNPTPLVHVLVRHKVMGITMSWHVANYHPSALFGAPFQVDMVVSHVICQSCDFVVSNLTVNSTNIERGDCFLIITHPFGLALNGVLQWQLSTDVNF